MPPQPSEGSHQSELRPVECVQCGRQSEPTPVWLPGWGCLYGTLSVCSQACAEAFARAGGYELKADSVDWEERDATVGV